MITDKDMSELLSLCDEAALNPGITHEHDREFYKAAKAAVPKLIAALKDKFSWPVTLDTLTRTIDSIKSAYWRNLTQNAGMSSLRTWRSTTTTGW
jgi:hypothetical protein